jgi:hypothetical protein
VVPAEPFAGAEWQERVKLIAQTAALFSKAEKASAYKLDQLAEIILGDSPGTASEKPRKRHAAEKKGRA